MTSAYVTSHQHSALGIDHLSLFIIIVYHVTWAEFSCHEACINQDFPDHLTLQLSTPPMMVAFESQTSSLGLGSRGHPCISNFKF